MPPKTVALIAAVALTIGWLFAAVLTPPVAKLQTLPQPAVRRPAVKDPMPSAERLQLRLRQAPVAPTPRRNPFVFGARERERERVVSSGGSSRPAPSSPQVEALPQSAVISGPAYTLAGIGASGDVRTAVLSDGITVHLVKVGDSIGGYRVATITETAITVTDAAGASHTLRLKN